MHGSLLFAAPVVVRLHVAFAGGALALGLAQWLLPRGTALHRRIGWAWVVLMVGLSLTSFGIRVVWPNSPFGGFSPIHLLALWTLYALWRGVVHARRGVIDLHRRWMMNTFWFALLGAGVFTLLPGRLLYRVFFE
jgi:uncharacterized membrane protein